MVCNGHIDVVPIVQKRRAITGLGVHFDEVRPGGRVIQQIIYKSVFTFQIDSFDKTFYFETTASNQPLLDHLAANMVP